MLALAFAAAGFASNAGDPPQVTPTQLTTGFFVESFAYDYDAGVQDTSVPGLATAFRDLEITTDGSAFETVDFELHETPPFRELFASCNVDAPPGTGFALEVSVGTKRGEPESPWLWLAGWGDVPASEKTRACEAGRVDVDTLLSERDLGTWRLRLHVFGPGGDKASRLRVHRIDVCIANRTLSREDAWRTRPEAESRPVLNTGCTMGGPLGPQPPAGIAVPFRSQRDEDASIASRVCSPTSVAMLLAYRGVVVPTADVAARLYDAEHAMYGNWSRAIQGAFSFGVPGYLTRFATWDEVTSFVRGRMQPLVISIAAAKGELTGAPYAKTDGHLLVLRGFDTNGDVFVNDPAAKDAEHGVTKYARAELERCWMGHGGVAYVLLPRAKDAEAAITPR